MNRTISEQTVWNILRDLGDAPVAVVAKKYGLSRQMVNYIDRGTLWKHVLERYEAEQDAMTEAELDALVASRLETMPEWSEDEEPDERPKPYTPAAVQRGRGIHKRAIPRNRVRLHPWEPWETLGMEAA